MSKLTDREMQIVRLLAYGHTSRQIAYELRLSVRIVEYRLACITGKLGLRSRAALLCYARAGGPGRARERFARAGAPAAVPEGQGGRSPS